MKDKTTLWGNPFWKTSTVNGASDSARLSRQHPQATAIATIIVQPFFGMSGFAGGQRKCVAMPPSLPGASQIAAAPKAKQGQAGRKPPTPLPLHKPLHRYRPYKHWVFSRFNPLHDPLQGVTEALQIANRTWDLIVEFHAFDEYFAKNRMLR